MQDNVLLIANVHHFVDKLVNNLKSSFLIAEMWPHRAFPELLNQDVNESIKDARRIEKLLEYFTGFVWGLLFNVIKQG